MSVEESALTSPGPFEGPEKLLELWFAPSLAELPDAPESSLAGGLKSRPVKDGEQRKGLRKVPKEVWEEMLDIVKCKVLSTVEGDDLDAYLLSESSLFVAPHLLILKTCGTTLNLLGLYRIIEIARQYCGFNTVYRCFYSRKSFFFPERQQGPHRDWRDEVQFLDRVFGTAGAAYTVGPMNRDHWLLYLTTPNSQPILPSDPSPSSLPPSLPPIPAPAALPQPTTQYQDTTLEILMTHLSPQARAPFFHESFADQASTTPGHVLGQAISSTLGIDQLFSKEETNLDSFGFDPCGYSANAVIGSGLPESSSGKPGGGYFTIHVTPEEGWSYASFECNVPLPTSSSPTEGLQNRPDLQTLIKKVVNIFQPSRLSITLFVSTPSPSTTAEEEEAEKKAWNSFGPSLLGKEFVRKDRIGYEFDGYDLVFACFEKKGWVEPKMVTEKPAEREI
ncbi:S-adenosylmethionine decarboxylase proenzyme [Cryptococcus floricola]|uniref:adenosylmethionine decarboxylase n=1 Tax=Cryptococcus floricola TaxID=2591691 RepID=A0A5D3AU64_9TREE|nr:S-adenosylmethionine decarboxylase proenzyme [Cryptococcus floricola]